MNISVSAVAEGATAAALRVLWVRRSFILMGTVRAPARLRLPLLCAALPCARQRCGAAGVPGRVRARACMLLSPG